MTSIYHPFMVQIRRFISLRHLISDLRTAVIKRLYTFAITYNLLLRMPHFFATKFDYINATKSSVSL